MSDTTRSDRDYVVSNATSIASTVSSAGVAGGITTSSFSSSTSLCPSMEPGVVEAFLGCCRELFSRVNEDVNNVAKIGDGFVRLDNVMAGKTNTLNMQVTSSSYEVGSVSLGESKDSDIPTNAEIRSEIEAYLAKNGGDFKLKDRSKEEASDSSNDGSYGYYVGGNNNGGSQFNSNNGNSNSSPNKVVQLTEKSKEVQTEPRNILLEKTTEQKQDGVVSLSTEKPKQGTPTATQTIIQQLVAQNKEPKSGIVQSTNKTYTPSTHSTPKTTKSSVETTNNEPYIDTTEEAIQPYEEPILEDYYETPEIQIDEDKLVVEQLNADIVHISDDAPGTDNSSGLKTAAIVLGAGAALGAAGYGISKKLKEEKDDEEKEDYGWESEV